MAMAETERTVKDGEIVKVMSDEEKAAFEEKMTTPISEMPITMRTLQTLAQTPTVPVRYRDSPTGPQDMMAAVITGRELGVAPMASIRQLYLVNGQASMMAMLMAGLVFNAGHRIRYIVNIKDKTVTAEAWRIQPDGEWGSEGGWTFGEADAKLAGLNDKGTYQSYPFLMYAARATSALCRLYFPEVLSGIGYVPDEIGIEVEPEALYEGAEIVIDGDNIAEAKALDDVIEVLDAEIVESDPGLEAQD
jgi:hypothetical protein